MSFNDILGTQILHYYAETNRFMMTSASVKFQRKLIWASLIPRISKEAVRHWKRTTIILRAAEVTWVAFEAFSTITQRSMALESQWRHRKMQTFVYILIKKARILAFKILSGSLTPELRPRHVSHENPHQTCFHWLFMVIGWRVMAENCLKNHCIGFSDS